MAHTDTGRYVYLGMEERDDFNEIRESKVHTKTTITSNSKVDRWDTGSDASLKK